MIEPLFPEKKWDVIGYLFGKLDRGEFYRTQEHFKKLLTSIDSVELLREGSIAGSYPSNLRYYILKNLKEDSHG